MFDISTRVDMATGSAVDADVADAIVAMATAFDKRIAISY